MNGIFAWLILGMIFLTPVAWAKTSPQAQSNHAMSPEENSTEAKKSEATELLKSMNIEQTMSNVVDSMTDGMIQQNPVLGPYRAVLRQWAAGFMNWDNFGPPLVNLYATSFTEAELRDLTTFYKSPTGRKAITLLPQLTRSGMEIGVHLAKQHQSELEQMIKDRARELQDEPKKP
jgi:hypothetical protein